MDKPRYTVDIVIAAPGTPLLEPNSGELLLDGDKVPQTSLPGHMFYVLHGPDAPPKSRGFAPKEHGSVKGPGEITPFDAASYKDPRYTRTIEISEEQYKKLEEFGDHPTRFGFSEYYQDVRNNCVDFTWAALNHAGIERKKSIDVNALGGFIGPGGFIGQTLPDARIPLPIKGEGKDGYRPLRNIHGVDSIDAPFPDSDLNKTHYNEMPKRDPLRRVFSEEEQHGLPADRALASGPTVARHQNDPLLTQINQGVARLDDDNGRSFDSTSLNIGASLYSLAKTHGITQVDHVLLSERTAQADAAQTIFIVQGDRNDPAHVRAGMPTAVAAQTPAAASFERAEQLAQAQVHTHEAPQQHEVREQSGPRMV